MNSKNPASRGKSQEAPNRRILFPRAPFTLLLTPTATSHSHCLREGTSAGGDTGGGNGGGSLHFTLRRTLGLGWGMHRRSTPSNSSSTVMFAPCGYTATRSAADGNVAGIQGGASQCSRSNNFFERSDWPRSPVSSNARRQAFLSMTARTPAPYVPSTSTRERIPSGVATLLRSNSRATHSLYFPKTATSKGWSHLVIDAGMCIKRNPKRQQDTHV